MKMVGRGLRIAGKGMPTRTCVGRGEGSDVMFSTRGCGLNSAESAKFLFYKDLHLLIEAFESISCVHVFHDALR